MNVNNFIKSKATIYALAGLLLCSIAWLVWTSISPKSPLTLEQWDATPLGEREVLNFIARRTIEGKYLDESGNKVYYAHYFDLKRNLLVTDTQQPFEHGRYTVNKDGCIYLIYDGLSVYFNDNGCMYISDAASDNEQYEVFYEKPGEVRTVTRLKGNAHKIVIVSKGERLTLEQWREANELLTFEQATAVMVGNTDIGSYVDSENDTVKYAEYWAADGTISGVDGKWGEYTATYKASDKGCVQIDYEYQSGDGGDYDACIYMNKSKSQLFGKLGMTKDKYELFNEGFQEVTFLNIVEGRQLDL